MAVDKCSRGDHFCVQQRVLGNQPVEISAMAISPIEHGRYGEGAINSHRMKCRLFSFDKCLNLVGWELYELFKVGSNNLIQ